MARPLRVLLAATAGYAIGSIPFGVLMGRMSRGVDVREHGSHSMGTTNVLRTAGLPAAAATFGLDVSKGAVAVGVARGLRAGRAGEVAAGLGSVVGHSWPALSGFRGGKSVATAFGSILVIAPRAAGWAVVAGLGSLAATRIVSVGSLAATAAAAASTVRDVRRDGATGMAFTVPAAAIILWRHRANLERLRRGAEPRLGSRREAA
jgi:glycerol-3-phosphate acyltransferase PlsY